MMMMMMMAPVGLPEIRYPVNFAAIKQTLQATKKFTSTYFYLVLLYLCSAVIVQNGLLMRDRASVWKRRPMANRQKPALYHLATRCRQNWLQKHRKCQAVNRKSCTKFIPVQAFTTFFIFILFCFCGRVLCALIEGLQPSQDPAHTVWKAALSLNRELLNEAVQPPEDVIKRLVSSKWCNGLVLADFHTHCRTIRSNAIRFAMCRPWKDASGAAFKLRGPFAWCNEYDVRGSVPQLQLMTNSLLPSPVFFVPTVAQLFVITLLSPALFPASLQPIRSSQQFCSLTLIQTTCAPSLPWYCWAESLCSRLSSSLCCAVLLLSIWTPFFLYFRWKSIELFLSGTPARFGSLPQQSCVPSISCVLVGLPLNINHLSTVSGVLALKSVYPDAKE